ncbi:hypothetical protein [Dyadobacter crusticola]|uniref:hypothetical protein n=1 Tax=Dyadobacter crusticola TaxID=292407 RepID=UPI0004E18CB5|nr:hypothetical protein [Dyadobacter crusticola]
MMHIPTIPLSLISYFEEFSALKTEEEREMFWKKINEKSASKEALKDQLIKDLQSLSMQAGLLEEKVRAFLPA